jgi:hypothetical protein
MKIYATSSATREIQVKTTKKYHFTQLKMTFLKKQKMTNIDKKGTLMHWWWECQFI